MSRTPFHERARRASPYAGFILAGLACIVCVSLSTVGRQGLGWLVGADLSSNLRADYNVTPNVTLPAVDPTRLAEIQATDEAALTITPGAIATVPIGRITPRSTFVALVTGTPAATPFPTSTDTPPPTQTPAPSATPTQIVFPTAPASFTPAPITPSPTNTSPPPATDTPTGTPTNTSVPPTDTPASPPPPATNTFTPSPSPTATPSATATSTATPSATTNPPPPPPLFLTIVNVGPTALSLEWTNESATDADFQRYTVLRSYSSSGPYTTTVAVIPVGTVPITSVVDSNGGLGLTTGTTYYYTVQGEDTLQASTNNPVISGIPSAIANPNPTPPPTCPSPTPPDCGNAGGSEDGNYSTVYPTQTLTLDLGPGNGILDGLGYDFVYYERETTGLPVPSIGMDWIIVELSMDNINWYVAFTWNTGSTASNSNVAPFATSTVNSAYCDTFADAQSDEPIPMGACMSWGGLYGTPPYNTGIEIDIEGVIPPPSGEGYRYIRFTGINSTQPAEIDAIERLN